MRRFYLILMTLWLFSGHATIIQVNTMEEVYHAFQDADETTLAIFDVDMVLVQPSEPAFQMPNMKRYSKISKRIFSEVPLTKQMLFLSLMTIDSEPLLIDARLPLFLKELQEKRIPTMALTANLTGALKHIASMEKWRVDGLRKLGIDFSHHSPYQQSVVFDELASYRGNFSAYLEGILFVNGTTVSKGEAFLSFLKRTHTAPSKIIFIDDREENLKSLETVLQKNYASIDYRGIHYTGALSYPSRLISEEEFEAQWVRLAREANVID